MKTHKQMGLLGHKTTSIRWTWKRHCFKLMNFVKSFTINNLNVPLQFRRQGYAMVDFICEYYSTVESLPVRSEVQVDLQSI